MKYGALGDIQGPNYSTATLGRKDDGLGWEHCGEIIHSVVNWVNPEMVRHLHWGAVTATGLR